MGARPSIAVVSVSGVTGTAGGLQFNKTETAILTFLVRHLREEYSIRAISMETKKHYPIVRENVLGLERRGVMKVKRINPTQTLCSLALDNPNNVAVFSATEFLVADGFFSRKGEIKAITDDVLKRVEGNSFTLVLFGSQVRGGAKPDSDIDLMFLVPAMEEQSRMLRAAEGAGRLTNRNIHPVVMAYGAFFDALREKGQNLPKEIVESHIIVYGAEAFYRGLIING